MKKAFEVKNVATGKVYFSSDKYETACEKAFLYQDKFPSDADDIYLVNTQTGRAMSQVL
jgi:hypothetical protein